MVFNAANIRRGSRAGSEKPPLDNPESREQQALINRVRNSRSIMPLLRFLHSVPNSTRTSEGIAKRMKREGVERGAFDLVWDLARGGWHGLRIEMKAEYAPVGNAAPKRNTLSEEQKDFAAFYGANGFLAMACYTAQEAWNVIEWYHGLPPTPPRPVHGLPPHLAMMAAPTVHRRQSPEAAVNRAQARAKRTSDKAGRETTFAERRAAAFASYTQGETPPTNPKKYPVRG